MEAFILQSLTTEISELKPQVEVLRNRVEDETVANTALRNQIQSLRGEYELVKKTHEEVIGCILSSSSPFNSVSASACSESNWMIIICGCTCAFYTQPRATGCWLGERGRGRERKRGS